jgi:hypothetical protein
VNRSVMAVPQSPRHGEYRVDRRSGGARHHAFRSCGRRSLAAYRPAVTAVFTRGSSVPSVNTPSFGAERNRTPAEQGRERQFAAGADRRSPPTARRESHVDVVVCELMAIHVKRGSHASRRSGSPAPRRSTPARRSRSATAGRSSRRRPGRERGEELLAAGPAVSVCGAGARPQRRTPGGQPATKRRTPRREPWESPSFTGGKVRKRST